MLGVEGFIIIIKSCMLILEMKTIRGVHWPVKFTDAVLHRHNTAD